MFDKDSCQQNLFDLRKKFKYCALTVEESSKRIFVLGFCWNDHTEYALGVHDNNGAFISSFETSLSI